MAQDTDRLTRTDREWEDRAEAMSEPHSETSHLIATDVPDQRSATAYGAA